MTQTVLDTLTHRLDWLEHENRVLKVSAGAVLVGLSALVLR